VVWGSNTIWGETSFPCPNRLWTHLASCALGTGSLVGITTAGAWVDHLSQFSAKVKEKVELYLYSPVSFRKLFEVELCLLLLKG